VKVYAAPVARAIPFDGSGFSPSFTSTNVQDAIGEGRDSAISEANKARSTIVTHFNGTVTNNQWLGYTDQLPGDLVPIVIPWNCVLREISIRFDFSVFLIFVGQPIDGDFRIYKNGTSAGDVVLFENFANVTGGKLLTGLNVSFSAGDLIRGRWEDNGDNPADMAIVYSFQLT